MLDVAYNVHNAIPILVRNRLN